MPEICQAMRSRSTWCFVAMFSLAALSMLGGGCVHTHRSEQLPEQLIVRSHTKTLWMWLPLPYGEAGIHYQFIGLGWIMTRETDPWVTVRHLGKEIAASDPGRTKWTPSHSGKERFGEQGWAASYGWKPILIGCADRQDEYGDVKILSKRRSYQDRPWDVSLDPVMVLGETFDKVVFGIYDDDRCYRRLVGFDSSKWQFIKVTIFEQERHWAYPFQLEFLNVATGEKTVVDGRYPVGDKNAAELNVRPATNDACLP